MRIITLKCPQCGTITSGNVLEKRREMKCPGLDCDHVIRFSDLDQTEQEHLLSNREKYKMG